MTVSLIDYYFARPGGQLPPVDESKLLDYAVGSNGVYVRGRRPGLEVSIPVSFSLKAIAGLAEVRSYAQWGFPRVPVDLVDAMLGISRAAAPKEALFHLSFDPRMDCLGHGHVLCGEGWHLEWPKQEASEDSVKPLKSGVGTSSDRAIIEVHSHHSMRAEFSAQDNEDESQGFRVYAVIGEIFTSPAIRARVGLWGHFLEYPAIEFMELPEGLEDAVKG